MAISVKRLPLAYTASTSRASALQLVYSLRPEWEKTNDTIELIQFTEGITNTDSGKGEAQNHTLLASLGLAPPLFARFENGLLYQYIEGTPCSPEDLRRPDIFKPIARRLAEWHARVPIDILADGADGLNIINGEKNGSAFPSKGAEAATTSIWSVMQRWIDALPSSTPKEKQRQETLQKEYEWVKRKLGGTPGIAGKDLVFSHCDLLSGNVIMVNCNAPTTVKSNGQSKDVSVNFIDYEYATPGPAAFDISNHFAEWAGFDCDYSCIPTRSQRRTWLTEYLQAFNTHLERPFEKAEVDILYDQVERFRGLPGLYWGIWALIQAQISHIDFDYATYAESRLGEYNAWKAETEGLREVNTALPARERRWAEE